MLVKFKSYVHCPNYGNNWVYTKIITEKYGQLFQQTQVIIMQIFYSETMETTLVTGITKASTICMCVCACERACSVKWSNCLQSLFHTGCQWSCFTGPYATFSFSSIFWSSFTGPYATFSFSLTFWLSVSTSSYTATACWCSCVFGAGLELRLFLFHLLMQTVSKAPHRAPVMNTTSEQTTAVTATAVAVERFFSGAGVRINYHGVR